ncbi:hypothetical protein [Geomicrobium sp. JCM 19039]|uniref:hypothetical protein n=1 Tax=Geomicrobium sp. JCM 19039 TaxID=1460636 RepID=UPI0006941508|nr:hypothetical protein [Geomicrobium sp. JCM 19039]
MKRTTIVYRALIVFAFAAFLLAVIGGRFLYVQIAQGTEEHDYLQYAERQWTSEQPLHGERGTFTPVTKVLLQKRCLRIQSNSFCEMTLGMPGLKTLLKPHGS